MGAAAAAESPDDANNVTMNSINDAPIGVSGDTGGAEQLLGASNDENLLSTDFGSFKDLEDHINANKGYEKTIYLDKDYIFNNETDTYYLENPIYLGTFVSIDGQGYTIDANNNPYIFNTIGQYVTLKNIVFKNTNSRAITVGSKDVSIVGCTFDNCNGNAINVNSGSDNCVIDNCEILNGNGIGISSSGTIVNNTKFENNTAGSGAGLSVSADNVIIENCEFINNTATNYGGAIYFSGNDNRVLTIINSKFINNGANTGGAIYHVYKTLYDSSIKNRRDYNSQLNIVSSKFTKNIAVQSREIYGPYNNTDSSFDGGLYYDSIDELFDGITPGATIELTQDYTLTHGPIRIILDNKDKLSGNPNQLIVIKGNDHIIDANGNNVFYIETYYSKFEMYNITIKNAYSSGSGGAMYIQDQNPSTSGTKAYLIQNSKFINNTAGGSGGAIYSYCRMYTYNNYFKNCEFVNNTAKGTGGAIYSGGNYARLQLQENNIFINNSAGTAGAVYNPGTGTGVCYGNRFINNSANTNGAVQFDRQIFSDSKSLNYFEGNTAFNGPIGVYSGPISNGTNTMLSDFPLYFENEHNVTLPNKTFEYPLNIQFVDNDVINGNGSTVIGQGQVLFSNKNLNYRNITLANMTLVNCTVSGIINLVNVTFINCTNPINCPLTYDDYFVVENCNLINCTGNPISSSGRSNVLYDVNIDGKNYNNKELIDYFNNGKDNSVITLPKGNYELLTPFSICFVNTTIDGNFSTITSVGSNSVFVFYSDNTTIKNFKIKNTNNGALFYNRHVTGDGVHTNVTSNSYQFNNVVNINFTNVSQAIYFNDYEQGSVINCTFDNSLREGFSKSMIYMRGRTSAGLKDSVINCTFKNIVSTDAGAALNHPGDFLDVIKCTFTNTSSGSNGGAINMASWSYSTVINSTFENNSALNGAAIYQSHPGETSVIRVSNSTFDGGIANAGGGSIFANGKLILDNCNFTNNTADNGGAIVSVDLEVTNSSFTNNSAVLAAGISSSGHNVVISGCNVSGNKADVGAGISLSGDNAVIDNVNFTDNTASVRGGALVTTGANTNVTNVNATGNSAPSGAAFVLDGDGAKLENSTIANNTGVNGEGSAVEVNGENIDILNNTVHGNDGSGVLVNGNGTNITGNHFNSTRDISINPNSDIYNNDTIMKKLQDENYPAGFVEILNDVDPTIIVSDVNVQQNTTFNITIQNNDFKGNVSVKLDDGSLLYNGTFNAIKDKDGIIIGPVLPVAGEKTVTVFFYGDPDFTNKTVNTTFIVSRVTPQMNITVANVTYGNNSIVEVRIGNKANGTITITIDDVEITGIPIVDGNATYNLGVLPAGNKTANVQFRYNTSDYYNNNIGNFTIFCVDKAESSISIVVNDTYDIGEDVNITVSTTGSSGNLTFKINDTVYPVVNGTVNITDGLALGDYVITATLDADENYTNKTVTKTFTIKKINTDL